jgi:hypothetical protein
LYARITSPCDQKACAEEHCWQARGEGAPWL